MSDSIIKELARTMEACFSEQELKKKLREKKCLNIKYGVDVTAPFLHLGHGVNLWMMRKLQEEGHKVQFLIGDFTTLIGDPTGKSQTRPKIDKETIEKNAQEFIKQVGKILITNDPAVFEVYYNSTWFSKMPLEEFLNLLTLITHSRLIERDMFQKRMKEQDHIYMHELLYPLLQGYDSVMLKSDLTIVGSDQLFNELMGRFYQEKFNQEPQVVMTSSITPGLDGVNKQSKSLNNYIAITDSPRDMFGKTLTLPDHLILLWMKIYTDISLESITYHEQELKNGKNPRDLKILLAKALVERYYSEDQAKEEENWFISTFSKKSFPIDAPQFKTFNKNLYSILTELPLNLSKSEIKRLFSQGAIQLDGQKESMNTVLTKGTHELKIGKLHFYKIIID